jgi:putative two-component system response regulator
MIVDDTPENLRVLVDLLREQGYTVRPIPNGRLALQAAAKGHPDLILLDIDMPDMDGYEVCRRLKEDPALADIPVLFISAFHDTEAKLKAFEFGGLDYVAKPFRFEEVNARVKTHLKLRRLQAELAEHNRDLEALVAQKVQEISASQMATIFALAKLAESRDDETGQHLERMSAYCQTLARTVVEGAAARGIDPAFVENITHAAPLHDIGKVGIPDAILLKPGKLTADEFEIMKTHSALGATTLDSVHQRYASNAFISMGRDIARYHHEKWAGTGYPEKLSGEAIPLCARIVAVADVYDALRSKRPYKEPFSHEKARAIIKESAGSHFDPEIVAAFERVESEFDALRIRMSE